MTYQKYQFVKSKKRVQTLILISLLSIPQPFSLTGLWEAWVIDKDGDILNYHYWLMEEEICSIIEPIININVESIKHQEPNNIATLPFIEYYQKLKIEHFLNNL